MLQSIQASNAAKEAAERKEAAFKVQAEECKRKAAECQKQFTVYQEYVKKLAEDTASRDRLTAALEHQNELSEKKAVAAEELAITIKKIFIEDRIIETIATKHNAKLEAIIETLLKIATLIQIQATKVIESLSVDESTKKYYNQLLASLETGLKRETRIEAIASKMETGNVQANHIIGNINDHSKQ